jgi:hypothetical protein
MARKRNPLWVFDLEATKWTEVIAACAVCSDGRRFAAYGSDCRTKLIELMKSEGGTWVAHFGGGYDIPLLLETRLLDVSDIILSGTNILKATKGTLKIRDSYPLTLAPLAKLAQYVGRKKQVENQTRIEKMTNDEILSYCLDDCEILMEALQSIGAFLKGIGADVAWTAGGAAIACLKALEPDSWEALRSNTIHVADAMNTRNGFARGGRVECWARGFVDGVYSYDIKSSYPTRYAFRPVGIGLRNASRWDREGVYRVSWNWHSRDEIPPVLDQQTLGGFGHCEAWVCYDELKQLKDSPAKNVDLIEAWAPRKEIELGQKSSRYLFKAKEDGIPWAKVFVNSLHGKFTESPLKDVWTRDFPEVFWPDVLPERRGTDDFHFWKSYQLVHDKRKHCLPHVQPIAGAQILGRARAALTQILRALQSAGWAVYYCDTDCVHTDCPPHLFPGIQGQELGQWALEKGPCRAIYLGPKAYCLFNVDGSPAKFAMKGSPVAKLANGIKRGNVFEALPSYEKGENLIGEFFETALTRGAEIKKEGVLSFVSGLRNESHWDRKELIRTNRPTGAGKIFLHGRPYYLAPDEIRARHSPLS